MLNEEITHTNKILMKTFLSRFILILSVVYVTAAASREKK